MLEVWLNRSGLCRKHHILKVLEAYPFFCMPPRDRITNLLMRIRFKPSGHFELFGQKHVPFLPCQKWHINTEINTSSAPLLCLLSNAVKHLRESAMHKASSLYSTSLLFISLTSREKRKKKRILISHENFICTEGQTSAWILPPERICSGRGSVLCSVMGSRHLEPTASPAFSQNNVSRSHDFP